MHLTFSLLGPHQQLGVWGEVRPQDRRASGSRRLPHRLRVGPPAHAEPGTKLPLLPVWLHMSVPRGVTVGQGRRGVCSGAGEGSSLLLLVLYRPCCCAPSVQGVPRPGQLRTRPARAEGRTLSRSVGQVFPGSSGRGSGVGGRMGRSVARQHRGHGAQTLSPALGVSLQPPPGQLLWREAAI